MRCRGDFLVASVTSLKKKHLIQFERRRQKVWTGTLYGTCTTGVWLCILKCEPANQQELGASGDASSVLQRRMMRLAKNNCTEEV